jgi:hypothetical protein
MLLVEVKNGKSPDSDAVFSTVTVPLHAVPLKFKAFPINHAVAYRLGKAIDS